MPHVLPVFLSPFIQKIILSTIIIILVNITKKHNNNNTTALKNIYILRTGKNYYFFIFSTKYPDFFLHTYFCYHMVDCWAVLSVLARWFQIFYVNCNHDPMKLYRKKFFLLSSLFSFSSGSSLYCIFFQFSLHSCPCPFALECVWVPKDYIFLPSSFILSILFFPSPELLSFFFGGLSFVKEKNET